MKQSFIIQLFILVCPFIHCPKTINVNSDNVFINEQGYIYKGFFDDKFIRNGVLNIPDSVNGIKVIGIGLQASSYSNINTLHLSDNIHVITNESFIGINPDTLILPKNLYYIEASAFLEYEKSIVLPCPQKKDHVFMGWNDSIKGGSHFYGYKGERYIASFEYAKNGFYQLRTEDVLVLDNQIEEVYYRGSEKIVIPSEIDGIKICKIKDDAFHYSNWDGLIEFNDLKEIRVDEGIEYIGSSCFSNNKIETLVLPSTLDTIGESAFFNNDLEMIILPDDILYIGINAFAQNKVSEKYIPTLPIPKEKGKIFLYWQSFKKGKYNRETKSLEEIAVAKCQPGDKMDLNLGYKAAFKEDL